MFASAIATFVAIFAGRFSFARIFPGVMPESSILGEIRFWALLLAGLLVSIHAGRKSAAAVAMPRVWRAIALVALVQFALAVHALVYSTVPVDVQFVWELMTIAAVSCVMGLAVRIWGMRFVHGLAWVAVFFATIMVFWMFVASFMAPSTDPERPFATTFTFYRIQLFGGFAALFLLFEQQRWSSRAILALVASICFASAYLSLSKAALLAGTGGLLLLAAISVIWFQKSRAAVAVGVGLAATAIFVWVSGNMFVARVSEGLLGSGYTMSTESVVRSYAEVAAGKSDQSSAKPPMSTESVVRSYAEVAAGKPDKSSAKLPKSTERVVRSYAEVAASKADQSNAKLPMSTESVVRSYAEVAAGKPDKSNKLSVKPPIGDAQWRAFEAQRRFAALVACTAGQYACAADVLPWEQDLANAMLQFHVFVPDYSFRIRLLTHGLRGISKAPWFGNGFGSFHAVAINLYTKEPEPYSHPHNIVVELLYSVGIIGTLFVFAVLAILLWDILRTREDILSGLPILMFVVSIAIGSIFGGDYMDFRLVWYGLLLCVILSRVQMTPIGRLAQ